MLSLKPVSLPVACLLVLHAAEVGATEYPATDTKSDTRLLDKTGALDRASKPLHWDGLDRRTIKRAGERSVRPKAPVFPAEMN